MTDRKQFVDRPSADYDMGYVDGLERACREVHHGQPASAQTLPWVRESLVRLWRIARVINATREEARAYE